MMNPKCCFCGSEDVSHVAIKTCPLAIGLPVHFYCCDCVAKAYAISEDEFGNMIDRLLAKESEQTNTI